MTWGQLVRDLGCPLQVVERYRVWHDVTPTFGMLRLPKDLSVLRRRFLTPGAFRLVAEVEATCLDDVFRKTNHTDEADDPAVHWLVPHCRSTSVGDVVVSSNGFAYLDDYRCWMNLGRVVY